MASGALRVRWPWSGWVVHVGGFVFKTSSQANLELGMYVSYPNLKLYQPPLSWDYRCSIMSVMSVLGEKLPFSGSIKSLGCQCSIVCLLSSTKCVTLHVCSRKRMGLVLNSLRSNFCYWCPEEGISIPVDVVSSNHELWLLETVSLPHSTNLVD